jgi:hypothetical protein
MGPKPQDFFEHLQARLGPGKSVVHHLAHLLVSHSRSEFADEQMHDAVVDANARSCEEASKIAVQPEIGVTPRGQSWGLSMS